MAFFTKRPNVFVKKTYILSFPDFYFISFRSVKIKSCKTSGPFGFSHVTGATSPTKQ